MGNFSHLALVKCREILILLSILRHHLFDRLWIPINQWICIILVVQWRKQALPSWHCLCKLCRLTPKSTVWLVPSESAFCSQMWQRGYEKKRKNICSPDKNIKEILTITLLYLMLLQWLHSKTLFKRWNCKCSNVLHRYWLTVHPEDIHSTPPLPRHFKWKHWGVKKRYWNQPRLQENLLEYTLENCAHMWQGKVEDDAS